MTKLDSIKERLEAYRHWHKANEQSYPYDEGPGPDLALLIEAVELAREALKTTVHIKMDPLVSLKIAEALTKLNELLGEKKAQERGE